MDCGVCLGRKKLGELKILIKDIIENQSSPNYKKSIEKEFNDPYGN